MSQMKEMTSQLRKHAAQRTGKRQEGEGEGIHQEFRDDKIKEQGTRKGRLYT